MSTARGSDHAGARADQYGVAAMAARLREARIAKFDTAADLARAIGMNESTVRAHENGQHGFPRKAARIYADILVVTPQWLLYGEERERSVGSPPRGNVRTGAETRVWLEIKAAVPLSVARQIVALLDKQSEPGSQADVWDIRPDRG